MKKLALIVGINYPGTMNELGGCVNDADNILHKLINEFGFKLNNTQLLIDEAATKKNILEGIDWLVHQLQEGDVGVFFYAGHGTRTIDLPPIDEPEMLDEAIVPIDAINDRSLLIRDDEIHEKLQNLVQGVHFVVIFDSCHSETGTRLLESYNDKKRMLPLSKTVKKTMKIVGDLHTEEALRDTHPLAGNHILLAGCKANESSFDNGENGYFTRALIKEMKQGITYQDLYTRVYSIVMNETNEAQHPQIEGPDTNRKIFE